MCLSQQLVVGLFFGFYFYLLFSFFIAAALAPFWDIPDKWSAGQFKNWCSITCILAEGCACAVASAHGTVAVLAAAITVIALIAGITVWRQAFLPLARIDCLRNEP